MDTKDASIIPRGQYCYQLKRIEEGEVLSTDGYRYGKDLRELRFHGDIKRVLCPYYETTEYGTVKCNFVGLEARDDRDVINAYFNDDEAADRFPLSWDLSDEIKVCGVDDEEYDDPVLFVEDTDAEERDRSLRALANLAFAAKGQHPLYVLVSDPRVPAKVREHAATFQRPARLISFIRDGEYTIHAANGELLSVFVVRGGHSFEAFVGRR